MRNTVLKKNELNELVSVIVPTYNRNSMLEQALKSLANQTYKNIEIIVIDDAKNFTTKQVVESFKDERMFYYKNTGKGANAARNCGIKISTGRYITFLDDDDMYLPNKIYKQIEYILENDVSIVFCYLDFIKNEKTVYSYIPKVRNYKNIYKYLLVYNFISLPSVLIKRDVLLKVNGFDETLKKFQDWDLVLRLAKSGNRFGCVREHLINVNIHNQYRITNSEKDTFHEIYLKNKNGAKNLTVFFLVFLYCIRNLNFKRFYEYINTVWF